MRENAKLYEKMRDFVREKRYYYNTNSPHAILLAYVL